MKRPLKPLQPRDLEHSKARMRRPRRIGGEPYWPDAHLYDIGDHGSPRRRRRHSPPPPWMEENRLRRKRARRLYQQAKQVAP